MENYEEIIARLDKVEKMMNNHQEAITAIGTTVEAYNDIDRMIRRIVADLEGVGV